MPKRSYRVKEVSELAGVSIRALHHYEAIGLLVPSARNRSGYRLYGPEDVLRLQQIVIGRELGLSLEAIRRSLDEPGFDRKRSLLEQRELLVERGRQTKAMIRAVDQAIALIDGEQKGGTLDLKELFDGFDPSEYQEEVEQRWGKTDAYRESKRRTERYTADDWEAMKADQSAIFEALAASMASGLGAETDEAMDLAERHRMSIDRWFYPCSTEMHLGLADLYESDPRYAENMDRITPGMTAFVIRAIRANASRRDQ
jgi:DNA-binding transcriptional MerR regulator